MQTEVQLTEDIKTLKIQGATNVALSILTYLSDTTNANPAIAIPAIRNIGQALAYTRPTEPLAQNAIRYIFSGNLNETIPSYLSMIEKAKQAITATGSTIIQDGKTYLTHCHASTVTNIFLTAHNSGKQFSVIATETRPLMQGRITVRELLDGGMNTVAMIVDSAAASVLADRKRDIAGVLVGADLLSEYGFANKIGSLAIVLAARSQNIPVYCISTLLKYDPRPFNQNLIETRDPKEIWPDAPNHLTIYAPAFDFTPYELGVTIVSEAGMLQGNKVKETALKQYPFIKE